MHLKTDRHTTTSNATAVDAYETSAIESVNKCNECVCVSSERGVCEEWVKCKTEEKQQP